MSLLATKSVLWIIGVVVLLLVVVVAALEVWGVDWVADLVEWLP